MSVKPLNLLFAIVQSPLRRLQPASPGRFQLISVFLLGLPFYSKEWLMIQHRSVGFGHQTPPNLSRSASRAGMLHFRMSLLFCTINAPGFPQFPGSVFHSCAHVVVELT